MVLGESAVKGGRGDVSNFRDDDGKVAETPDQSMAVCNLKSWIHQVLFYAGEPLQYRFHTNVKCGGKSVR